MGSAPFIFCFYSGQFSTVRYTIASALLSAMLTPSYAISPTHGGRRGPDDGVTHFVQLQPTPTLGHLPKAASSAALMAAGWSSRS